MGVPGAGGSLTVKNLDEADPALGQPACRQKLLAERTGDVVVQAIKSLGRSVLIAQPQDLGHGCLHPKGQFVRLDPARSLASSGYSRAVIRFNRPRMPALIAASEGPIGTPGRANGRGFSGSTSR